MCFLDFINQGDNTPQSGFFVFIKPGERRKFGAKSDNFLIFF